MEKKTAILVADDDAINREILKTALGEGYRILEAEDGRQALEILSAHSDEIEGIVLDLMMPRMDGLAFMERFVQEKRWRDIPVLVASGDDRLLIENRCLEAGAWDFIKKPFNPATVNIRVRNNISRKRLIEVQRRRVKDTFSRYMEPAVVDALLEDGATDDDLQVKSTEIAVLFVDIRKFTTLSEKLEPNKVVDILNRFLTLSSNAVHNNGGTLDKFIGDCTMAFWGAPLPCEDKAYLASKAAMDMMDCASEFADYTTKVCGHSVAFSLGLHMGTAVVGSFGSPNRKDYTAIGDTVNTAARLESIAEPGAVYISRRVADELGARAKVVSLGQDIRLKGKAEEIEILRLDSLQMEDM